MRTVKFASVMFSMLALMLMVPACGSSGDDDGGGSVDAAGNTIDAPVGGNPDAPVSSGNSVGADCTPDGTPQANCPADHICIQLQGGSRAWCTKGCDINTHAGQPSDPCPMGYTGPGASICLLRVGPPAGSDAGTSIDVCTVACMDSTQGSQVCGQNSCDGTCPIGLTCTDTGNMWSYCN